ncbi:hypothetical protein GGTG_03424 [Gaeumannomyces tritici R3-111a-1]|uniref:Uncharacterized protein n=1 Tax=Gaeumannomyces tritici (strain R3-111a-1) TaxID=644352 RepID=J3NQ67_GAET3|nr:hypothetical protein GGTG_03424 [Gaeumannomyces tritici R3-111a-1]EJT78323.1 hypothetical protein GGTG_03424 [Gaeumannomyces tritici R3-111a-1]
MFSPERRPQGSPEAAAVYPRAADWFASEPSNEEPSKLGGRESRPKPRAAKAGDTCWGDAGHSTALMDRGYETSLCKGTYLRVAPSWILKWLSRGIPKMGGDKEGRSQQRRVISGVVRRRPASSVQLGPATLGQQENGVGAWSKAADVDRLATRPYPAAASLGGLQSGAVWARSCCCTRLERINGHKGTRRGRQGLLVMDARMQPIFSAAQGSGDCQARLVWVGRADGRHSLQPILIQHAVPVWQGTLPKSVQAITRRMTRLELSRPVRIGSLGMVGSLCWQLG